jgi:integrase
LLICNSGVQLQQKIKIKGRGDTVKYSDEKPPTPDELQRIFNVADIRSKAAISLMAFSGLRIEVLGSFLGDDGIKLQDLPEMTIDGHVVEFQKIQTRVIVRKNVSKSGNQYHIFLGEQGCAFLKQYLEWRLRKGEKLSTKSPMAGF